MYRKEIQTEILQSFVAELGQWLSFAKRTPVALVLRFCRGCADFSMIQSISAHNPP